ncbi:MAG: hypothetical protein JRM85_07970 [Nitrososphaerota archaeon]|jgi:hypothetical protein|nr:hypothetical protein [Nitrososphaerota archaeon]
MPEGASLNMDIMEIYRVSCSKCKKKLEAMVRKEVQRVSADETVAKILGKK